MHHHHHHDHSHPHDPAAESQQRRRLQLALVLTSLFLVAEVVGGIMANSLALLADAGHMFTDVAALGLSLFVAWFSRQPATPQKTYGYLRWEVLAAFINGAALLVVSAGIVWEAIGRFRSPEPVTDSTMLVIAFGGLLVNAVRLAAPRPAPAQHEHPRRLPACPGGLAGVRRDGGRRPRNPLDGVVSG